MKKRFIEEQIRAEGTAAVLVLQSYLSPMTLAMSDETIMGRCKEG